MTMRLIPHAAAISEFIAGYHGDCGQCAELTALHPTDPARFPLDAAALATIVQRDVAHGWASSNGSEPLSAIASDLAALGAPHTNHGYSEPFTVDYRALFDQWGGIKPIILEFAHAGHLPGDESGVSYHFNTLVGWDAAAAVGLFADGDNIVERNGGTALVRYTLADLVAAGICGLLVVDVQVAGGTMTTVPSGWHDDAATQTLTAPNGLTVGTGFRGHILASATWDPNNQPESRELSVSETELSDPKQGSGTVQYFRFAQLSWTQARGVWESWVGLEAYTAREQLDAAQANLQAAQAQRDTFQAQVTQLSTQISALQAQLATAQNGAAPTPRERAALALLDALKAAQAVW